MKFLILDVFTEAKYAGNQLAVVFDAGALPTARMQAIARELNFSETTFLTAGEEGEHGWDVRIFTPGTEVPFAGHPTLGTAWAIAEELLGGGVDKVTLNLKAGRIPVELETGAAAGRLWMRQLPPSFGATLDRATAARLLSVDESRVDERFPAREVSTGLPFLIVPLTDLDAVRSARLEQGLYRELIEGGAMGDAQAVYFFCSETYRPENDLNARFFGDALGVHEDPATGSAAGCLAGYLVRYRVLGGSEVSARVEQGYEIGRPSLLLLAARERGGDIEIRVGGQVVPVARGELL